jgi:D-3-phosphoglycerate dehydrogenase / 2-oxoglutarate reductase
MPDRVVITDSSYPDARIERAVLARAGLEVEQADATTPEAVIEAAEGAVGLLNQNTHLPAAVFDSLDDLIVVGRYGVGVDNIDVEAAVRHDVTVVNVPSYCADEVATHTLSLLLACARQVPIYDAHVKDGKWDWKAGRPIHRFSDGTLGLIGFGEIPQRLAEIVDEFGLELVAFDPYCEPETFATHNVEPIPFNELVDRSDFISIHTPLTDETTRLFDEDVFARMNGTIVINTARGAIIDIGALENALESGKVAAAGLDVMPTEPPGQSSLFDRPNVIFTPHAAWYSEQSIETLRREAAEGILEALRDESCSAGVSE